MQTLTEAVLKLNPPGGIFDTTVISNLFPQLSTGARKLLVNRATSSGEILRIIPGLFQLDREYRRSEPHPFALAARLHAPSHISLESALSHHGLIPEAVFQISSVTASRSRTFKTPFGVFEFRRVPASDPRAGVLATRLPDGVWVYIAGALRAIADLVYARPAVSWGADGIAFLTDSMRMERADLEELSFEAFADICAGIRNARVREYLTGLKRELGK